MQPTSMHGHRSAAASNVLPARNAQIADNNALRARGHSQPELTPAPAIVAGTLLSGDEIDFLALLHNAEAANYCVLLLGSNGTAAAKMIEELRKATEFHYFGYWHGKPRSKNAVPCSGKLTANAAATKQLLKKYARRAYRGDTERRPVTYWERVAWLVWNCYASLMALRHRAETIKKQEQKRLAGLPAKRVARAKYMRRYRAQRQSQQREHAARYFTSKAKEAWRQQRLKNSKGVQQ